MPPRTQVPPAAKGEEGLLLQPLRILRRRPRGRRLLSRAGVGVAALQPAPRLEHVGVGAPHGRVLAVEARGQEDDGVLADAVRGGVVAGGGEGGVLVGDAEGHVADGEARGLLVGGAEQRTARGEARGVDDRAAGRARRDGGDFGAHARGDGGGRGEDVDEGPEEHGDGVRRGDHYHGEVPVGELVRREAPAALRRRSPLDEGADVGVQVVARAEVGT